MIERSEIKFGLTRIPFRIRRSTKRATVALTIDDGRLIVTAPAATTVDRLNAVVRCKAPWVVQHMDTGPGGTASAAAEREFITGETVLYLGRQYRLKVIDGDAPAALRGGWYEVRVPANVVGAARAREVRRRLAMALMGLAESYLDHRLTDLCRRLRIERPGLVVRDQRRRWGSCDTAGTLRINWRIVQAPVALIDYVLVHELAHRKHRAHDRSFWNAVEVWLPDYEERRKRLRLLGRALEW